MNNYFALYYICAGAGALMMAGGIWLIYKQKIYLSAETNEVLQVELPLLGKFKTNVPSLGLFIIGAVLLAYPIHALSTQYLRVEQLVSSDDHPVTVYVAVQTRSLQRDGKLIVRVPVLNSSDYEPELIYLAGSFSDQAALDLSKQEKGILKLSPKELQYKGSSAIENVQPDIQPPPATFKR